MKFLKIVHVAPAELQSYPGNAKEHDDDELDASVGRFSQFRSVLARTLEDGSLQLLAGHGTTAALARAELSKVRVELIEATDDEALGIVVADNAIGRRTGFNESALAELLGRMDEGAGFVGTGVTSADYDDLMAKLAEAAAAALPGGEADDDTDGGNTWKTADMQDLRDRYESKGTRTVSFDYSYPVFVWLAEQLAILREQKDLDSNSALFVHLIEQATDSKAPASLADEAGPADGEVIGADRDELADVDTEHPEELFSGANDPTGGPTVTDPTPEGAYAVSGLDEFKENS